MYCNLYCLNDAFKNFKISKLLQLTFLLNIFIFAPFMNIFGHWTLTGLSYWSLLIINVYDYVFKDFYDPSVLYAKQLYNWILKYKYAYSLYCTVPIKVILLWIYPNISIILKIYLICWALLHVVIPVKVKFHSFNQLLSCFFYCCALYDTIYDIFQTKKLVLMSV